MGQVLPEIKRRREVRSRIFTTITSDEQYFLNEKAVPYRGKYLLSSLLYEGNVYRLIAGSKLPAAEKFESWIFDELVPETLKNGGYILGKNGETDNAGMKNSIHFVRFLPAR